MAREMIRNKEIKKKNVDHFAGEKYDYDPLPSLPYGHERNISRIGPPSFQLILIVIFTIIILMDDWLIVHWSIEV